MGALLYDNNPHNQVMGDVKYTMMHESTPFFQHYKPIINNGCKQRILIPSDDNALIRNSFVSLMEFYMNGFMKL